MVPCVCADTQENQLFFLPFAIRVGSHTTHQVYLPILCDHIFAIRPTLPCCRLTENSPALDSICSWGYFAPNALWPNVSCGNYIKGRTGSVLCVWACCSYVVLVFINRWTQNAVPHNQKMLEHTHHTDLSSLPHSSVNLFSHMRMSAMRIFNHCTLVKNERFHIHVQMAVPLYNNSVFLKYLGKVA